MKDKEKQKSYKIASNLRQLLVSPGFHCNLGLAQYDHFKPTKVYVVPFYLVFKIIGKLFTFSTLSRGDFQKLSLFKAEIHREM